jgi:hypothetical protein
VLVDGAGLVGGVAGVLDTDAEGDVGAEAGAVVGATLVGDVSVVGAADACWLDVGCAG